MLTIDVTNKYILIRKISDVKTSDARDAKYCVEKFIQISSISETENYLHNSFLTQQIANIYICNLQLYIYIYFF
jgi:hypothetical protein